MRSPLLFLFLTIIHVHTFGQNFKGKLLNKTDSTAFAFAAIKLTETGKYTTTDEKGEFTFSIPEGLVLLHVEISYVGCKTATTIVPNANKINTIYVACAPSTLNEIVIEGLTAKEIVKRALANIPKNYSDSSYASPSFYSQYQKINGKFRNLIEAQTVVMFNLSTSNDQLLANESFATEQLRRSKYYPIEQFDRDNISDLMNKNPIYHLTGSSLDPNALEFYLFSFDTSASTNNYIINYKSFNFTSENHGITNYATAGIDAEGRESGKLTIDKNSFAIIKFERKAVRNKGYNYPKYNNFVLPDRKFTQEFVEGHLLAEYEIINNKWYLKTMVHSYTNEFFRTQTYEKAYTITDCFEWYANTVTRYINKELINKFYFNPDLFDKKYSYNNAQWELPIPAYYYFDKQAVYKDLGTVVPIEQQFETNGK